MRRLAILTAQVILAAFIAEVLLHIWNPIPFGVRGSHIVLRRNDWATFRNPPSVKLDRFVHYRTNSLGFRGPEPPRDLSDRLSIVTVGGSTTGCFLLNDGDTWPDRLGSALAVEFPRVWLENAGIDGQSTFGHLVLLHDYVVHIRPEVILFLVGVNDVALSAANWFDARVTDRVLGRREIWADWLVTHSELASLVQNLWRARRAQAYGLTAAEIDYSTLPAIAPQDAAAAAAAERQARAAIPAFADRVRQLVDVSRSLGSEPVLMTQPALYGAEPDPATGIDLSTRRVNEFGSGGVAWRSLDQYNAATRSIAATKHVELIDLARELPKDSRYFYDFVHFSKAGSAKVAEIARDRLAPALDRWCRDKTIVAGCDR